MNLSGFSRSGMGVFSFANTEMLGQQKPGNEARLAKQAIKNWRWGELKDALENPTIRRSF